MVSLVELEKAALSLKKVLDLPMGEIERDATIQRFEYTLDLAWKTARKKMGSASSAPKMVIREMADAGLISDARLWIEFVDARNLTSHSYNEKIADEVYKAAKKFYLECTKLLQKLKAI